jgi:hypothetical protein
MRLDGLGGVNLWTWLHFPLRDKQGMRSSTQGLEPGGISLEFPFCADLAFFSFFSASPLHFPF